MDSKTPDKVKLWQKLVAVPSIVGLFFVFLLDRLCHVLLPFAEHKGFKKWLLTESSLKLSLVRITIVILLVVVLKLIF